MLSILTYIFFIPFVFSAIVPTCLKCPSCTKCDTKKGTCTLPRDFVSCTKTGVAGSCYAGVCNTKVTLSPVGSVPDKCTTYNCDSVTGACVFGSRANGFDCSTIGVPGISVCYTGKCTPVALGLSTPGIFPLRNIGCIGLPNGYPCDTNDLFDGETCQNGVCTFTDGSYYGYLPGTI